MNEPLTIYECPTCGAVARESYGVGWTFLPPQSKCFVRGHHDEEPREVRVFREEDVRKLWDCCYDASGHHLAPDDFPAPEEWR